MIIRIRHPSRTFKLLSEIDMADVNPILTGELQVVVVPRHREVAGNRDSTEDR